MPGIRGHGASGRLIAAAALAAAVTAGGLAPASAAATAGGRAAAATATTSVGWIITGWNIHLLDGADHALTQHFFNTPSSFGTSPQPARGTVPSGYAATPILWYTSYRKFASDLQSGAITFPFGWVYYDPEHWAPTPVAEQQDPATYLRLFGQLAHAHGLKVIEAPARDLGVTTGEVCPKLQGETLNAWYLRCDLAGMAALYSDKVVIQDQANTRHLRVYDHLFKQAKQQALAAHPQIPVFSIVSTDRGTPDEMAAAAKSIRASGFYVTIRAPAISRAVQFYTLMQAAGY